MLEVEGLPAVERGKQGESHEQEMEDSISLSAPSSSRKRVASSSISEFKDEFFAQSEDNSVAAPIKKLKGSEALETAAAPEDIPLEILNMPPMECSDIAGAVEAHPLENELIDNADVQDYNVIKEREQSEEPSAGMSRDVDSKNEDDAFMGTYSVKLKETTPDEFPINEGQDVQQSAVDAEDEKEEGELVPDTPEQPTEGIESEETQPESILAEVAEVGGGTSEIGDWFEIGTPDVLIEDKNEKNDNVEEVGDGSDKSGDHVNDNDFEQSPLTTLGSPECSPNIHVESTSETVSSNAVSGVEEGVQQGTKSRTEGVDLPSIKSGTEELEQQAVKSGGTTITLAERAKERALMRQAGIGVPRSPPRGRGRGSGSFRRDSGRGARGARSGRGQSSSE
uniref:Nuclear-pore anchor n=2 Tax=Anthurium amnicola TaxID=1678845 RepID=A0A1D1ZES9_9ARAE